MAVTFITETNFVSQKSDDFIMEKLASTKQKIIDMTANYAFKLTTISPVEQGIVINASLCSLTGELISHCEIPYMEGIYSLSPGFWQSFISIDVCGDCIPALASSCKKQLMGFFVCLLFFLKVKRIS